MEMKLHAVKVKKAMERKRMQELAIKIIASIAICFTLIFATVIATQAINKKYQTVIVKKGETVWNIAHRVAEGKDVRGLVSEISSVNGIDPDYVVSGQEIIVPIT